MLYSGNFGSHSFVRVPYSCYSLNTEAMFINKLNGPCRNKLKTERATEQKPVESQLDNSLFLGIGLVRELLPSCGQLMPSCYPEQFM